MAAEYLKHKGYKIIERNYSTRYGEIDLIASYSGAIIFVEVKTRLNTKFGWPEEAVTETKKDRLQWAANIFLEEKKIESDYYFEILSLLVNRKRKSVRVKHLKDF